MQLTPFIVRDDVYALAYPDKSKPGKVRYALKEASLTPAVIHEHLLGRELVGVYTLSPESTVRFFAIDFDGTELAQAKAEALAQGQVLAGAGLVCYYEVSRSGNGVHLWGFFDEPLPAADVRAKLKPLCVRSETYDRLYPLQNAVTESLPYGNLLALPFYGLLSPEAKLRHGPGFHGGGSYFYDPQTGDRLDPEALLASLVYNRAEYFQTLPGIPHANSLGRALPVLAPAKQGEALRPKQPLNGVVKLVSPYGCSFMRNAYEQRATLSEPAWWTALGQLSCFVNGRDAAHMFSEGYPTYSAAATDEKFDRFLEQSPHSCAYIQEHFPELACKQCPNTAPYRLAEKPILDLVSESVEPMERPTFEQTLEQIRRTRDGGEAPGLDFGVEAIDQYTRIRPGQMLVFGAFPSIGKCLDPATELQADDGSLVTVQDYMLHGNSKVTVLDDDYQQQQAAVTAYHYDGVKATVVLTTATGRKLRVTPEHPLLTPRGWIPAGELGAGDQVAVPTSLPHLGNTSLPQEELDHLALLLADGCYSRATYTKSDPVLVALYVDSAKALWPDATVTTELAKDRAPSYRINSGSLRVNLTQRLLEKHELTGLAHTKRIPQAVWRAPRQQLARFVGLLWSGDGWVGRRVIEYGTASEGLARDLVHALLRLGIFARLSYKDNAGVGCWTVGIRDAENGLRFIAEVPLFGKRAEQAQEWLVRESRYAGNIDAERYADVLAVIKQEAGCLGASVKGNTFRVRRADHVISLSGTAQRLVSRAIYWDTITTLEQAAPITVVDLTVEPWHNFVAGDMYLHNTAYAVDLAVNLAEQGVPVMFFSAETGRGGIETRLLSRKADIDSKAIRGERRDYRGEPVPLTDDELEQLHTAAAELRTLPIYVNYTTCNPDRILDAIDELLLRYRIPFEGPYVVMVDYLQFANTSGSEDMAEHQRLAKLTNEFKHITKITKQPLLLFSQLKREKENGDEDPNLNWFKGTGRIETDADVAFIMTGTRTPGPVAKRQLWSVKDREGEAGWVADLVFHQSVSRFETPPKLSKAQFQQDVKTLFDEPTSDDTPF